MAQSSIETIITLLLTIILQLECINGQYKWDCNHYGEYSVNQCYQYSTTIQYKFICNSTTSIIHYKYFDESCQNGDNNDDSNPSSNYTMIYYESTDDNNIFQCDQNNACPWGIVRYWVNSDDCDPVSRFTPTPTSEGTDTSTNDDDDDTSNDGITYRNNSYYDLPYIIDKCYENVNIYSTSIESIKSMKITCYPSKNQLIIDTYPLDDDCTTFHSDLNTQTIDYDDYSGEVEDACYELLCDSSDGNVMYNIVSIKVLMAIMFNILIGLQLL